MIIVITKKKFEIKIRFKTNKRNWRKFIHIIFFWRLIDKHINIFIHTITKNATELNMYNLFGNNLLLNFKIKKDNKSTNKSNDNIFFEEKLVKTYTNFLPNTQDLPILINLNFNLTLSSLYLTTIQPVLHKIKLKKARLNANKKLNSSFYTPAFNNLNLSI